MNSQIKEPLFAEERQHQILELLKQKKKILVPELCSYFAVSPATIRNDLNDLESKGLLKRTHGGAIPNTKTGFEPNTKQKQINQNQKEAIAMYAATLVENGDTIAIDTGTTMYAFAEQLKSKSDLTVVTNDLKIASFLEDNTNATIILAGGIVRKGFHCTVGPLTDSALSYLRVDKTFLATNGITAEDGLSTPDINQAEVKKQLIKIGAQRILLCDSSKVGTNSFANFSSLDNIDLMITDSSISNDNYEFLSQNDIRIEVVK